MPANSREYARTYMRTYMQDRRAGIKRIRAARPPVVEPDIPRYQAGYCAFCHLRCYGDACAFCRAEIEGRKAPAVG